MKALCVPFLLFAFSASATTVPSNTTLRTEMKTIATTYEKLGRQIDDKTKNKSSRRLTNKLIEASLAAQSKTPPGAEKLEGPVKDEMLKKYQAEVQGMIDHLASLRAALAKNDNAEARKHYDALKPWTTPDHAEEFK